MNTYFQLTIETVKTLGLTRKFTAELVSVISNYPNLTNKVEDLLSLTPEVMKNKRTLAREIRAIIGY
jgi:ribosomal protein L30/L7E